MPLDIVPLQPEHLKRIHLRQSDERSIYLLEHLFHFDGQYKAFAGIENDTVLGIGGFIFEENSDEAEGFLALSDQATECPVRFTLVVRNRIRQFLKEYPNIKRLRAYVDNKYVFERMAWIVLLGFNEYRGPSELSPGWATFVMKVER